MANAKRNGDKLTPVLLRLLDRPPAWRELGSGLMLTSNRDRLLLDRVWLSAGRRNVQPSEVEMRVLRATLNKMNVSVVGDEIDNHAGWHIKRLCIKVNTK